ncbi:MAG TPA: avidin/streptavidin family protein [Longimicrobium sp.]|nr:avidin/streptavidin family protein [Longimicrobium sp.]
MPVDGIWYNELGSVMTLTSDGTSLSGTYVTPVGEANGTYTLTGSVNTDTDPALGWVVLWNNNSGDSNSVTTWCGQYYSEQEVIIAMWLLRSEMSEGQNWAATQVGEDIFTRISDGVLPPGLAALRAPSHPAGLGQ